MAEIVVVGSLNLDTTVRVGRLPAPGETVLGTDHTTDTGGKGANQAVAAARLGRSVAMVGRIGADDAGSRISAVLTHEAIDVANVTVDDRAPTGMAFITVDAGGENIIVVSSGANATLIVTHIEQAEEVIANAAVLLLQLEVPIDVVHHAAALCSGIVILNPAPAAELPAGLLEAVNILVPNRTELAMLTSTEPATEPEEISRQLDLLPIEIGIVTLGAQGALVRVARQTTSVPAPLVEAVDATAAGDAFCAGLADALAGGADPVVAARWAVRVGAATVTRRGAQASLPTRAEVEAIG